MEVIYILKHHRAKGGRTKAQRVSFGFWQRDAARYSKTRLLGSWRIKYADLTSQFGFMLLTLWAEPSWKLKTEEPHQHRIEKSSSRDPFKSGGGWVCKSQEMILSPVPVGLIIPFKASTDCPLKLERPTENMNLFLSLQVLKCWNDFFWHWE